MDPDIGPIPIKDRASVVFVERGQLDVLDGAFVVVDKNGVRTQIPVGGLACLMLEPGSRVSHAAAALAARVGCLLVWVGEAGVRVYSAGQPGGARSDRLLYQARLALDEESRLRVAAKMYEIRFGDKPPPQATVDQLRGIEGARVKAMYQIMGHRFGVNWTGRRYDPSDWSTADPINRALSAGTSCLYGVTEAAVLAAGYAPAIGFIHTGKPLSFVYDIADLVKFETVVPEAFRITARGDSPIESAVRHACRDAFRRQRTLERLIPLIDEVLSAGGVEVPTPGLDMIGPAFEEGPGFGDAGHRS